ncbi:MAG: hypothetical protein HRT44_04910 [Bdellovibrionales bacterium]|nr:hypothetical protein [Bdellovibrionales bacterium]NQZ18582.1 hypothetical protein [Bdellovibrionales bacterium]
MKVLGIALLTLFFAACTPIEETDSSVPGSENPSLTSFQRDQSGIVTGAIRDLLSYANTRSASFPMGVNEDNSLRTEFRQRLDGSINESLCLENATSQVYDLEGEGCPVRFYSSFTKFNGTSDDGANINRYRFSVDFLAQSTRVLTDLQSLKIEGTYGKTVSIEGDNNRSLEQMQVGADGISKTMGEFRFVSSMSSNKEINFESGARTSQVQRTDTFEYRNFKAVFYFESQREGDAVTNEYYLNGDSVSQLQYIEYMQEFSGQLDFRVSATRSSLSYPGSFDQ